MKILLILSFSSAISATNAFAQAPDMAVWRPHGPMIADSPSPIPRFIQQDIGPIRDSDRVAPGSRMNQDEDGDQAHAPDHGRAGAPVGGSMGSHASGPSGMQPSAGGMMAHEGARFHLRKGDATLDVHCPSETRFNECVEATGAMLDRLGGRGTGGAGSGPR